MGEPPDHTAERMHLLPATTVLAGVRCARASLTISDVKSGQVVLPRTRITTDGSGSTPA